MLSIVRRLKHQKKVSSILAHQVYRLKVGTHGINVLLAKVNTDQKLPFVKYFRFERLK